MSRDLTSEFHEARRFQLGAPPREPSFTTRSAACTGFLVIALAVGALTVTKAGVHYVDGNNASPAVPYSSWATAAKVIQDAVDSSSAGDEVVVTDGFYASGGKALGAVTNRVAVDKAVTVRSVAGPQFTVIVGGGSDVLNTMHLRCVYLADGARLQGFTLTNGVAIDGIAPEGGGLWCQSSNAVASNCVIVGNFSTYAGGGVSGGTLYASIIMSNSTSAGGRGLTGKGGGAFNSILNNCLIIGNQSGTNGGGAYGGTLTNCTLVGNAAPLGNCGGGAAFATINNCINYYNTPDNNCENINSYCCTTPDPGGTGNITAEPLFVAFGVGNLRLQSNSPCINAGDNSHAPPGTDLDGNPRIIGGTVDMGAYEFIPSPAMRIALGSPNMTLAWPLWASNFVAQEAGGLPASSGGWSNVTATVSQSANENVVIVPATNAARFFRLFLR